MSWALKVFAFNSKNTLRQISLDMRDEGFSTELTFSAAIKFNSQARYVMIVGLWMKADEASVDVRSKKVFNDSVSVSVPSKYLK